jgi:hypothetical protein
VSRPGENTAKTPGVLFLATRYSRSFGTLAAASEEAKKNLIETTSHLEISAIPRKQRRRHFLIETKTALPVCLILAARKKGRSQRKNAD